MAVTVDTLKLTQTQGVVAVRGTAATGTIALATTLKKIYRNAIITCREYQRYSVGTFKWCKRKGST